MRHHIVFEINGRQQRVAGSNVFSTLSDYLRYLLGATGTKVVCAEGDCGACTVLMRRSADEEYKPINSCIQSLGQLDGASIVTVEGLKIDGRLNAVQEAMVTHQGAQCGYCTPGFVVAMSALFESHDRIDEQQVRNGLTGNLCRCTGYEPIIKSALAVDAAAAPRLRELYPSVPEAGDSVLVEAEGRKFFAPATIEEAIRFKSENAPVTIVQGGTDVGVWVNKRNFAPPAVLSLAHVRGLDELREENGAIVAGANVTLATLETFVRERIPQLHRILNVFGAPQIKNAGTLAGNIANGSPIGDTLPLLYVNEAVLELTGLHGTREVAVPSFYLGYKKFDLAPDELITRIRIPMHDDLLRLFKVSRRKDLDISAFTAGIRLQFENGTSSPITKAWVAYGGVGPTVLRLMTTETFLIGKTASLEIFEEAGRIARNEIAPISDVRGSKDYRLQLAENIMAKFWYETFGSSEPIATVSERRSSDRPFA